jgi:hypothetical protein
MKVAVAQGRRILGLQGQGQPVGGWGLVIQLGRPIGHNQIEVQQAAPGIPVDAVQEQVAHSAAH